MTPGAGRPPAAAAEDPQRTWRLGVAGWPVAHSRSPRMQRAALWDLGLRSWSYAPLPMPPEVAEGALRGLPGEDYAGLNVTIPHKALALEVADVLTPSARAIGAANTLTRLADGRVEADNTDAPGLLEALGRPVAGRRAVVLGAGGSARACAWALREAGCATVGVWNRTAPRAEALAADLGVVALERPGAAGAVDVLVNATSVGLDGEADPWRALPGVRELLDGCEVACDLVYHERGTALLAAAAGAGAVTVDGLAVLVAQGALSLERWTGRDAPRASMDAAARRRSPTAPPGAPAADG